MLVILIHPAVLKEEPLSRDVIDTDGFLADIQIVDVDATEVIKVALKDCIRDIDHFFSSLLQLNGKNHHACRLCR